MSKYEVHRNPKVPSPEETKKYQNFDSLLDNYESMHKPWWVLQNVLKKPKIVKALIVVTIVVMTLIFSNIHNQKKKPTENQAPERTESGFNYLGQPQRAASYASNYL